MSTPNRTHRAQTVSDLGNGGVDIIVLVMVIRLIIIFEF
jgi:hypothetical protein